MQERLLPVGGRSKSHEEAATAAGGLLDRVWQVFGGQQDADPPKPGDSQKGVVPGATAAGGAPSGDVVPLIGEKVSGERIQVVASVHKQVYCFRKLQSIDRPPLSLRLKHLPTHISYVHVCSISFLVTRAKSVSALGLSVRR